MDGHLKDFVDVVGLVSLEIVVESDVEGEQLAVATEDGIVLVEESVEETEILVDVEQYQIEEVWHQIAVVVQHVEEPEVLMEVEAGQFVGEVLAGKPVVEHVDLRVIELPLLPNSNTSWLVSAVLVLEQEQTCLQDFPRARG